jgi:hypothetical protein
VSQVVNPWIIDGTITCAASQAVHTTPVACFGPHLALRDPDIVEAAANSWLRNKTAEALIRNAKF